MGFSGMTLFLPHFLNSRTACSPKYTPGGSKQFLPCTVQKAVGLKPGELYLSEGNASFVDCGKKNHSTPHVKY